VAFDFPQDLLGKSSLSMAVIPGGDELIVKAGSRVRILARDMSSGTSFEVPSGYGDFAASEQFLYMATGDRLCCLTHAGAEVASYEDQEKRIFGPVLGPDGLLFCVLSDEFDYESDEIIALDAQTLQPRHRFGLSLLECACGVTVVGDEVFVCDYGNDRIQVFSLAGEHRRSMTSSPRRPIELCFVDDRLYVLRRRGSGRRRGGRI